MRKFAVLHITKEKTDKFIYVLKGHIFDIH
jgi:hypothetical protein